MTEAEENFNIGEKPEMNRRSDSVIAQVIFVNHPSPVRAAGLWY